MTTPTPQQRFARRFWCDFASDDLATHFFLSTATALRKQTRSGHEADLMSKLDELLANLGYSTTMQLVIDELEASHEEIGFWCGNYVLYDDGGARYELAVGDETILSGVGMRLTDASFSDRTLVVSDDQSRFTLTFSLPAANELETVLRHCQPRCQGTVTLTLEDETTVVRTIEGKRDCYTRAGVQRDEDGDPLDVWRGVYGVSYPNDDGVFVQSPDQLVLGGSEEQPSVAFAGKAGTDVVTGNNGLVFTIDEDEDGDRFAGVLAIERDGTRRLTGMIRSDDGSTRPLLGYWTKPAPVERVPGPHAPVRRAMLLGDAVPSASDDFDLDVKTIDPVVRKDLPRGVERNPYHVRLVLKNATDVPAEAKDVTWTIENVAPEGVPFPLDLVRTDDVVVTSKSGAKTQHHAAVIDATWGETQHALIYKFDIKVEWKDTKTQAMTSQTFHMRLLIDSRANMDITPDELTTIPSGQHWEAALSVTGGMAPFTWTRDERKLPDGITFKDGVFSGKTTASQQTFSTVVSVSADPQKLKMATTSKSYTLSVKEPEQIGGVQAGWVLFALTVLGSALGAGVFLFKRWKEGTDPADLKYEAEAQKVLKDRYVSSVKSEMRDALLNPNGGLPDLSAKNALDALCTTAANELAIAKTNLDAARTKVENAGALDPRLLEWKRDLREATKEVERARDRRDSSYSVRDRWDRDVTHQATQHDKIEHARELIGV